METRITKSNAIINASYRLSLNELRIVLFGLSHIDPRADEFPLDYKINIRDLAEFYDIGDKDRGSFYDDIKDALITKFWEREFSYYDDILDKVVKRRWLIEVQYGGKDGILYYSYNPKLKTQLQKLSKRFTSYFLSNVAKMKSAYAVRIYEIAVMYLNASCKGTATFTKTIKELKSHLGIEEKYVHFFNMRSKVLEIAKRDINRYSDIRITYLVKKIGRTPHKIEFVVTRKTKAKQPNKEELNKYKHFNSSVKLPPAALEKAKAIVVNARTGWDLYVIEQQFYDFVATKEPPKNLEAAFLGFVKKKVANFP